MTSNRPRPAKAIPLIVQSSISSLIQCAGNGLRDALQT